MPMVSSSNITFHDFFSKRDDNPLVYDKGPWFPLSNPSRQTRRVMKTCGWMHEQAHVISGQHIYVDRMKILLLSFAPISPACNIDVGSDIFPRGEHSLPHQVEIRSRYHEEVIALNFLGLDSSFSSWSIEELSEMEMEKNPERGWLAGISSLKDGFNDFKIHLQKFMMWYVADSSKTAKFP